MKHALDQNPAAAQADVWIGGVPMTRGYAEDWYWHHAAEKAHRERLWTGAKAVSSLSLAVASHWPALVVVVTAVVGAIVGFFGSRLLW